MRIEFTARAASRRAGGRREPGSTAPVVRGNVFPNALKLPISCAVKAKLSLRVGSLPRIVLPIVIEAMGNDAPVERIVGGAKKTPPAAPEARLLAIQSPAIFTVPICALRLGSGRDERPLTWPPTVRLPIAGTGSPADLPKAVMITCQFVADDAAFDRQRSDGSRAADIRAVEQLLCAVGAARDDRASDGDALHVGDNNAARIRQHVCATAAPADDIAADGEGSQIEGKNMTALIPGTADERAGDRDLSVDGEGRRRDIVHIDRPGAGAAPADHRPADADAGGVALRLDPPAVRAQASIKVAADFHQAERIVGKNEAAARAACRPPPRRRLGDVSGPRRRPPRPGRRRG